MSNSNSNGNDSGRGVYYSMGEVAAAGGVSYEIVLYHRQQKNIPEPGHWGGRRVYTPEQYEAVVAFFRARGKWQRQTHNTSTADVARQLGVTSTKIRYALITGQVAEPEWLDGKRAYQDADVERLRQYFAAKKR